ncbi:MAG: hypothetical protein R2769_07735 [Saprospiraceae bacterium]
MVIPFSGIRAFLFLYSALSFGGDIGLSILRNDLYSAPCFGGGYPVPPVLRNDLYSAPFFGGGYRSSRNPAE